ncbi:hypothetical protein NE850_38655 [Paraburkholderia sp. USG1]|uniref:TRAFAC clade GTPase domain-containing protein n=1 Tax=Paraburkholderia sp. USG1 TaxID=2952268 RepID=UPI0028630130|nr:hypothetical protein [Paraburkholderia sp. USG1]MDR8402242.1 hypothetical protein [Paraburkholderia sp. USG1]
MTQLTETSAIGCERDGCNPAESGCIDGLPIAECPRRIRIDPVEDTSEDVSEDLPSRGSGKLVHNGDAFTLTEADAFLRRYDARVIAFIGCPDVGKTTAAVMLYEMAKRRKLDGYKFAGSRTIRGFQERAHLALVSSGQTTPDTPRTPVSKPPAFLHLQLVRGSAQPAVCSVELLLADRTGEDFVRAIDKPSLILQYPEIERANCHVVLVDGKKLADMNEGPKHLGQVRRLIRALSENKAFVNSELLQIALTKHDEVLGSEDYAGAQERFELIVESAKDYLKEKVRVTAHRLAARPLTQDVQLGDGILPMLDEWSPSNLTKSYQMVVPKPAVGRMYDRLNNLLMEV